MYLIKDLYSTLHSTITMYTVQYNAPPPSLSAMEFELRS